MNSGLQRSQHKSLRELVQGCWPSHLIKWPTKRNLSAAFPSSSIMCSAQSTKPPSYVYLEMRFFSIWEKSDTKTHTRRRLWLPGVTYGSTSCRTELSAWLTINFQEMRNCPLPSRLQSRNTLFHRNIDVVNRPQPLCPSSKHKSCSRSNGYLQKWPDFICHWSVRYKDGRRKIVAGAMNTLISQGPVPQCFS